MTITRERLAELRAMLSTEPSDMEWMIGGCDGSIRQTEILHLLDAAERLAEAEAERDRLQSQLAKAAGLPRQIVAGLIAELPSIEDATRLGGGPAFQAAVNRGAASALSEFLERWEKALAELDASLAGGEGS